jgi:hypothetical protein
MTGPEAGNYSVTLDGTVTTLAGQSPFTVYNTSLYFATGLNASVEHSLEVENESGKLSLLENGFITFVSDLCVEGLLLCLLFLTTSFNFYFGSYQSQTDAMPFTSGKHVYGHFTSS